MGRQAESSAVTNSIEVTLLHIHMWTVDRQNHLQNQNHNHLDMWAGKNHQSESQSLWHWFCVLKKLRWKEMHHLPLNGVWRSPWVSCCAAWLSSDWGHNGLGLPQAQLQAAANASARWVEGWQALMEEWPEVCASGRSWWCGASWCDATWAPGPLAGWRQAGDSSRDPTEVFGWSHSQCGMEGYPQKVWQDPRTQWKHSCCSGPCDSIWWIGSQPCGDSGRCCWRWRCVEKHLSRRAQDVGRVDQQVWTQQHFQCTGWLPGCEGGGRPKVFLSGASCWSSWWPNPGYHTWSWNLAFGLQSWEDVEGLFAARWCIIRCCIFFEDL